MRETERAEPGHLEGMHEGDVIVVTRVGAEREQDLDGGLTVAHFQGDGEGAGDGDLSAVGRLAHAAAGEIGHGVFVEAAGGGVLELEVGGGQGGQGEGEEGELHV